METRPKWLKVLALLGLQGSTSLLFRESRMDGVLLDSESRMVDIWVKVAKGFGSNMPHAVALRTVGVDWEASCRLIQDALGENIGIDRLKQSVNEIQAEMRHEKVRLKPGVVEALECLHSRGIHIGLATSASQSVADAHLGYHRILSYFTARAHGDEVLHCKPFPDVYYLAAFRIGCSPASCIAIEDSYSGLQAAKSAGMTTVMIPDLLPPTDISTVSTDFIVRDLFELTGIRTTDSNQK